MTPSEHPAAHPSHGRPSVTVPDIRLQRLLFRGAGLASLGEYAAASEMDIGDILTQLEPWLDGACLELEAVSGEIFLHTAPQGRPHPAGVPAIPSNLWELLRQVGDPDYAMSLWKIVRGLQQGGWRVRTHPAGSHRPLTFLELYVERAWTPMIILPRRDRIGASDGPLSRALQRQVPRVSVVCASGELDPLVAAIRGWMSGHANLEVIVLEQPRYTPVVLSTEDTAMPPTSAQIRPHPNRS